MNTINKLIIFLLQFVCISHMVRNSTADIGKNAKQGKFVIFFFFLNGEGAVKQHESRGRWDTFPHSGCKAGVNGAAKSARSFL